MNDNNQVKVNEPPIEKTKTTVKHKVVWTVIFILIAVLSVVAVTSFNKNFSFKDFFTTLKTASPLWIIAALAGMLGSILCEAFALMYICRSFGYKKGLKSGLRYSATGIYFSAITPSATGGQPAQAYIMMKDGIPGVFTAVALLVNLLLYTLSTAVLGVFAFIARPLLFMRFSVLSRVIIIIGSVIQFSLAFLVFLLLRNKKILFKIGRGLIHLVGKLRLTHNKERLQNVFEEKMSEYDTYSQYLHGKKPMMIKALGVNIIQRVSLIAVAVFTFLAIGGAEKQTFNIFVMQIYVILGSTFVPIPGAIGITDYLMIDGFSQIMPHGAAATLELLSRTLAFYIRVFLCGIFIVCEYFRGRKSKAPSNE